jgi:hypothetical protein
MQRAFCTCGGFFLNQYEIGGPFSGIIVGISNTVGTIPGFLAPYIVNVITKNVIFSNVLKKPNTVINSSTRILLLINIEKSTVNLNFIVICVSFKSLSGRLNLSQDFVISIIAISSLNYSTVF